MKLVAIMQLQGRQIEKDIRQDIANVRNLLIEDKKKKKINKMISPAMRCETCGAVIKCDMMAEAEQRARIHMEETGAINDSNRHFAVWKFEDF